MSFQLPLSKSFQGTYVCSEIRRKQVRTGAKVSKIHAAGIPKRFQFADSYLSKRNITYKESPISFLSFSFSMPSLLTTLYRRPQSLRLRADGRNFFPSYRNTNDHLIYANTLEQNRFRGGIKYEVTSTVSPLNWLETRISTWWNNSSFRFVTDIIEQQTCSKMKPHHRPELVRDRSRIPLESLPLNL